MRHTPTPPEPSAAELLRELVDAGARVRQHVGRTTGLGDSDLGALQHLAREPLGPAEVARRLGVSTAAATGIVDRLAARGHVERRAHAHDRRRTDVHLTDSGRAEVMGHLMPMLLALRELDDGFTPEERAVVARYLRGAIAAFAQVSGD